MTNLEALISPSGSVAYDWNKVIASLLGGSVSGKGNKWDDLIIGSSEEDMMDTYQRMKKMQSVLTDLEPNTDFALQLGQIINDADF